MDVFRFVDLFNSHFVTTAIIVAMYMQSEDESSLILAEGRLARTAIPRVRVGVDELYHRLGPVYFRRSHRMSYEDFQVLSATVVPYMEYSKCHRGRNGPVPLTTALSATLRFLSGGSVYDIMLTHGVSHSTFYNCVWHTLAAINRCPLLMMKFPSSHEEQLKSAKEFSKKSVAGFDSCVGCIDGMLLWVEKPSKADCCSMKTGDARFYCSRKGRYGFNLQAVCDANGRFTRVWIKTPGASSDFLSFIRSDLYNELENGLLLEGLVLFGDSAYVSNCYMVTPYRKTRSGVRDDFNYYQSQVSNSTAFLYPKQK
jgi:hypothetical protein